MTLARLATLLLGATLSLPALAQSPSTATAPRTSPPAATAPAPSRTASTPAASSKLVDTNSASEQELDKLPGIGKARAEAIIKNRPYHGKDDLAARRIQQAQFWKNLTIMGGMLVLLASGGGRFSLDGWRRRA